jgi:3-dehydroquinate synthase
MDILTVNLGNRSYDIVIGSGILSGIGEKMRQMRFSPKVCVISNPAVFSLYGDTVMSSLEEAYLECFHVLIPDGEEYKNFQQSYHVVTELLGNKLDRQSCLVALGGGVIGDLTGFVASVYMRGIHFVQLPTTLLAQVDSSVGGKTGVNHHLGKNMIGSFYQPRLVWIDTDTLRTLAQRQFLSGMAEVIKYGVIWDGSFFDYLMRKNQKIIGLDRDALRTIIKRSCQIKAAVVSQDEREEGMRAILNYGHTIGHAIETETNYTRFLHGEAVAIGMHLEARLSRILKIADDGTVSRIREMLDVYSLPSALPKDIQCNALFKHMSLDKKTLEGQMKFIIPEQIGKVRIQTGVHPDDIKEALNPA